MTRFTVAIGVLAACLFVVPGTAYPGEGKTTLRFAVMIPRTQGAAIEMKKINKRLDEMTGGKVAVRVYWGGAAGDDKDVLRKMRVGQIDGAPLSLEVLSNVVRECLVLMTPGLFENYKQVDAARAKLTPQFNKEAYKNGFKVLFWGDVGRLRLFSKQRVTKISDFKRIRPWLYKESELLKAFYKQVGATGVPLGIGEVYGAMQTGMIDTYWATAVLASALQWHSTSKYISARGLGFISGAVVYRRGAWDPLDDTAKNAVMTLVDERLKDGQRELRKSDAKAFKRLLKRGYTALEADDEKEWWNAGAKLRRNMIGRIYTKKLVLEVERLARKYATKEQLANMGDT